MKTETLAIKYRPRFITDLIGQDPVVTQFNGMIKSKKLPTTFILSGPSGTGKTTTARLFASYINCDNLKDGHPCGKCVSCKFRDNHPDVMELNIADTRGIDDVRALIQVSKNSPSLSSKRIFILDECHQLTAQAAQLLLKPLEEPPRNTLWILATTNPEKLPATILGRCHKFKLSLISKEALVKRLYSIAKEEGVSFKKHKDVLERIADLSNGQMRDSISMLEAALFSIHGGTKLGSDLLIQTILASTDSDLDDAAAKILSCILKGSIPALVRVVKLTNNVRGIINKLKWLLDWTISDNAKVARYRPNSAVKFIEYYNKMGFKIKLAQLIRIQYVLLEIEFKLNSTSIDESILFITWMGNLIVEFSKK
jgi:DNA polymerase III subunit gamma/tau